MIEIEEPQIKELEKVTFRPLVKHQTIKNTEIMRIENEDELMLLHTGFHSECAFLGTPNLILIHTSIIFLLLIFTWKNIDIETNSPTCLLELI